MKKRIIAVFTGNRAEYGLQYPILKAINEHPNLDYKLLVSGAHLDQNFGGTIAEIKRDGFHIDAEIKIDMEPLKETVQIDGDDGNIIEETSEFIIVHYIGWNIKWVDKLTKIDFETRVRPRHAITAGPHRPRRRY